MDDRNEADLLQGQLASTSSSSESESLERRSVPINLQETDQVGQYLLKTEDADVLKDLLRHNVHLERSGIPEKYRFRFRDLEFTRQLSTFDRQNPKFTSSQFHGFFTLFWLGVALLLVKVAANNWRIYGTVWGKNEIIRLMFRKDVLILGLTDFVMCWSTLFCLGLQRAIRRGYLSWSGLGWVVQNVYVIARHRCFAPDQLTHNRFGNLHI
jgi:sterol O-acyltransferase